MTLESRLLAIKNWLTSISTWIETPEAEEILYRNQTFNQWHSVKYTTQAVKEIASWNSNLELESINAKYSNVDFKAKKGSIGLILAGNIPLVGFHDLLCVLLSGYKVQVKLSSEDKLMIPTLLNLLKPIDESLFKKVVLVERLKELFGIIATGSDNSARYFDHYFGKYPNIIRKSRTSIAWIKGSETADELQQLGNDVFDYFGRGCRSVTKLFVPKGYNWEPMFDAWQPFNEMKVHNKYANNYDYNRAIYLLSKEPYIDWGFVIMKNDKGLKSPVAVVYFEEYDDLNTAKALMAEQSEQIQVQLSAKGGDGTLKFGESQSPSFFDWADGIDTIATIGSW